MEFDLAQLRALDATVREGTLEAAARALHVTPSAISQRLRALEVAMGRILLVRTKPVQVTESGQAVLRPARQADLLPGHLAPGLGGEPGRGGTPPRLGGGGCRPGAPPGFARRGFAAGPTAEALARAPVVVFDR